MSKLSRTQRREQLILRCQEQRGEMVERARTARNAYTAGNAAIGTLAKLVKQPWALGGLIMTVIAIKPRRIMAGLKNGKTTWDTWKAVAPIVQKLLTK